MGIECCLRNKAGKWRGFIGINGDLDVLGIYGEVREEVSKEVSKKVVEGKK